MPARHTRCQYHHLQTSRLFSNIHNIINTSFICFLYLHVRYRLLCIRRTSPASSLIESAREHPRCASALSYFLIFIAINTNTNIKHELGIIVVTYNEHAVRMASLPFHCSHRHLEKCQKCPALPHIFLRPERMIPLSSYLALRRTRHHGTTCRRQNHHHHHCQNRAEHKERVVLEAPT